MFPILISGKRCTLCFNCIKSILFLKPFNSVKSNFCWLSKCSKHAPNRTSEDYSIKRKQRLGSVEKKINKVLKIHELCQISFKETFLSISPLHNLQKHYAKVLGSATSPSLKEKLWPSSWTCHLILTRRTIMPKLVDLPSHHI